MTMQVISIEFSHLIEPTQDIYGVLPMQSDRTAIFAHILTRWCASTLQVLEQVVIATITTSP